MAATRKRSSTADHLLAGSDVLVTIGDWLRYAVTTLAQAEIEFAQGLHGPQEEALFLVARSLSLEPDDIPQFLHARLTPREIADLKEKIRRRVADRIPVAYLLREAWQANHRFYVDERVLIPRSYIAELIPNQLLEYADDGWSPQRILEIGTGSGALAIIAAHSFPDALVDAVDISPDALAVAERNVALHGLEDRVHLLKSDLFNRIPDEPYDLIIANPPYEPREVVEMIPPELSHEPRLALLGGEDGMELVRRIMNEARRHLTANGILVLELGELRPSLEYEFPHSAPHIFDLADGTDAVLGFKAGNLPASPGKRARPSR